MRKYKKEELADKVTELISFIDDFDSAIKQLTKTVLKKLKEAFSAFKEYVLEIKATYKRIRRGFIKEEVTILIQTETGRISEVQERDIPWEDLPSDIRKQLIRHADKSAISDIKHQFEEKAEEALKKGTLQLKT
jgi:hypothetical protein